MICEKLVKCKNLTDVYTLHVIETSKASTVEILSREVKKAFWITWPNIVCHIEDEASSESDKKVKWYSDCHNNLTNDVRMAENKASAEWDCHRKADKKLAQANSEMMELEAKLMELQQELAVLQTQDKGCQLFRMTHMVSRVLIQNPLLADQARKGRRARCSHWPSATGASSRAKPVHWYWLMNWCRWCQHHNHRQ